MIIKVHLKMDFKKKQFQDDPVQYILNFFYNIFCKFHSTMFPSCSLFLLYKSSLTLI